MEVEEQAAAAAAAANTTKATKRDEKQQPIFRDIRRYTCEYCGIVRSKKSLISSHIHSHHQDKIKESVGEGDAEKDQKKMSVCEQCGVSFRKPAHLKQHMQSHSAERPYTCSVDDCRSSYSRKDHLTRHLLSHRGKLFECPVVYCNRSFAFQGNMTRHVKEMHEEETVSTSPVTDAQTQYVCSEIGCGKVFKYASKLRKHEDSHAKLDTVEAVCSEPGCMKPFTNAQCLKAHFQSCHAHITCEICETKQLKKNIKRHLRSHESTKDLEKIKCSFDDCVLKFSTKSNLQQHIKAVHYEQKPFACTVPGCGKRFSFKHVRDKHEKSGCHVFTAGDFVETDELFRSRPRGGRKRECPPVESLTRKRVSLPSDSWSVLNQGSDFLSWSLS